MPDSTDGSLVVTDDELVAIAYLAGQPWTRPLATVDVADEDSLLMAVGRGLRSLSLRGIVDDEARLSTEADHVVATLGRAVRLAATSVTEEYHQRPDVERLELVEGEDGWYAVTAAPGGVWRFSPVELELAKEFFSQLAAAYVPADEVGLLLGQNADRSSRGCILVGDGGVMQFPIGANGEPDPSLSTPIDLSSIEWALLVDALIGATGGHE